MTTPRDPAEESEAATRLDRELDGTDRLAPDEQRDEAEERATEAAPADHPTT